MSNSPPNMGSLSGMVLNRAWKTMFRRSVSITSSRWCPNARRENPPSSSKRKGLPAVPRAEETPGIANGKIDLAPAFRKTTQHPARGRTPRVTRYRLNTQTFLTNMRGDYMIRNREGPAPPATASSRTRESYHRKGDKDPVPFRDHSMPVYRLPDQFSEGFYPIFGFHTIRARTVK